MHVYQRGKRGTWWVDLTVDGERIKRSAGTTDKRQAEEYGAHLARDLWRAKRLGETPQVTWDQAVIDWIALHQGDRAGIDEYRRELRWLSQFLAGKPLAAIDDKTIEMLAKARREQDVHGRPTSAGTVNHHMTRLGVILNFAHERGQLPVLPKIPKFHVDECWQWITHEQANRLLAELPAHMKPMAALALACGLRESNVRLLRWSRVDLRRRVAWVNSDEMKNGYAHNIPLNDLAMRVFEGQHGKNWQWVFPVPRRDTKTCDAPTRKISTKAWRKACERADLPTLRFHDLRHTWASWHVQNGTPLAVLQELGGWRSISMVQKYAHLGESHLAQWAGNIGIVGTTPVQVANGGTWALVSY